MKLAQSIDKLDSEQKRTIRNVIIATAALLLAISVMALVLKSSGAPAASEMTTSELVSAVESGEVSSVSYDPATNTVTGEMADGTAFISSYGDPASFQQLVSSQPDMSYSVTAVQRGGFNWGVLISVILIALMAGAFIWFARAARRAEEREDNATAKAKSKEDASLVAQLPDVTFDDVAGIDEAVEEVAEIREFLEDPDKFIAMGASIPKGILLSGSPGCGKSLLAKAIAGEAGRPFYSLSGSEFVHKYVGVGAQRVRDLFKSARENAPAIIFIDEIDAIGRARSNEGNDERESTLNQLLVEMDGFRDAETVVVLAATNRPDMLDEALVRPGRFDRKVTVTRPDLKGRREILAVHSRNKKLEDGLELEDIARITSGLSGAELANLMNEAAILAVRRGKEAIGKPEVDEALERLIAGPEKKRRVLTEEERRTIAYHECGHALVGHMLDAADPVKKITIIPRGQALGYTLSMPEEDRALMSQEAMQAELAVLLGGRVAEEICNGGNVTTGASNDIQRVTKLAWEMVTKYGMSRNLGAYAYGELVSRGEGAYSDKTAALIDEEVKWLVDEAHEQAHRILTKYNTRLDHMAEVLLEQETVSGDEAVALLEGKM